MNTRNWPIRSKIIGLVIVPLAALLALWIFATTLTVGPALKLLAAQTLLDEVGKPGEVLVDELKHERRLSMIHLAGGGDVAVLGEQRSRTDQAINDFRRRASSEALRDVAGDLLVARLDQTLTALDILPSGRGFIDRREMDRSGALGLYSSIISATFQTFSAMATLPDEDLNRRVRAVTELGQARELLGQADALLAGVFTAGRFAEGEHQQLVQLIGNRHFVYDAAVADLRDTDRAAFQRMIGGEAFVRLRAMEEMLVAEGGNGAAPPINAEAWYSSYDAVYQQLRDFELAASEALAADSRPVAVGVLVRLALAGILGLAAVVASVMIAVRIGRVLIKRLTGLRAAALEMAGERLPAVVERLRRGEEVDVAAETPSLEFGADEIGQVGHAFSEVQRTAIRSAVDEAALRRGLNEVFLNIARRSQTLLHRQLSLLDHMERRTTDPEKLEDLFRIDHMATRMRRHAEDLVVLAGATPGRGWRKPVPMIDVIRGAVSEVEDYIRVDIVVVQPAATAGRAVGDVIHLLAELIENATAFSPPHTRVQISGQEVPNGYAIEVEDRGLGMTAEAIDDANRRLVNPPEFDPANSARLGLFVVARLGARHGVRVRLRPSSYGGVTAVALIPADLVVLPSGGPLALPGQPHPAAHDQAPAAHDQAPAALPATADGAATQEIHRSPTVLLPALSAEPPPAVPQRRVGTTTRLTAVPTGPDAIPDSPASSPAIVRRRAGQRGTTEPGEENLPRRIRQTSLAPQLRESPSVVEVSDDTAVRSPEQVRAAMAALQAGTARGRREAGATSAGGAPARGTATPPAGTMLSPPPRRPTAPDQPDAVGAEPSGPAPDIPPDSPATDGDVNDSGRNA